MFFKKPLWKKRWLKFKQHKRGFFAAKALLFLCLLSFFTPFIANDKPLLISYKGQFYSPIFKTYPETTFGGSFETTPNYKDLLLKEHILKQGWMIWPLIPYGESTINYQLESPPPSPPSLQNWLGTDDQGRDLLARTLYGLRLSLAFGLLLTFFSTFIGIALGALQGYFGGLLDLILQRATEVWSGLPTLFVLVILSSFIEPNFWWLLLTLLLFKWVRLVAIVRAEFLRARNLTYIKAAQALGVSSLNIMYRHILPNAMAVTLIYLPFLLNGSLVTLVSLDFLGVGFPAGTASIGEILSQAKNNLHAPWLALTGVTLLSFLLVILTFLGEAARDAFDPRKFY